MTRRVFFSFHYCDVMRVQQIRQMGAFVGKQVVRFDDAAAYEKVKKQGDAAIKRWILAQLNGTSVTVVLIGTDTWRRPYVRYEIEQSYLRGNGLLGIHINGLRDVNRRTKARGRNPFAYIKRPRKKVGALTRALAQPHQMLTLFMLARGSRPVSPWSARSAANMPPPTLAACAKIYPAVGVSSASDYKVMQANIGDWIEAAARDAGR